MGLQKHCCNRIIITIFLKVYDLNTITWQCYFHQKYMVFPIRPNYFVGTLILTMSWHCQSTHSFLPPFSATRESSLQRSSNNETPLENREDKWLVIKITFYSINTNRPPNNYTCKDKVDYNQLSINDDEVFACMSLMFTCAWTNQIPGLSGGDTRITPSPRTNSIGMVRLEVYTAETRERILATVCAHA